MKTISEDWPLECALRLEDHLSLKFKHGKPYNDKGRSLIFNLTDEKNPKVRLALLYKKVTPEAFLAMDIRHLASDELKRQREVARKADMQDKRTDWATEEVKAQGEKYKGLFPCEYC